MQFANQPELKAVRRKLRSEPPQPEKRLWGAISNRKCCGVRFRRQCSIGRYVVDFFSFERNLVIEVDGDSHYTEHGLAADAERDAYLRARGLTVIRFTNHEVMSNLPGCFDHLEHFFETGELREK